MKRLLIVVALILTVLTACGKNTAKENETDNKAGGLEEDNKIVIGVSPVPHEEIIEHLKPEFEKEGLDVEVVTFEDYVQPNLQLSAGDIDANFFQHLPYLEEFTEERDIDNIVNIGLVHLEPIAFYSKQIESIDQVPEGGEIIIPNDATNGARALILLEDAGLIKLADRNNLKSTEKDIVENPKNLKFIAMDAPNIPRAYAEATGAVINSNYAIGAGINPIEEALQTESIDSPYGNLVAIRKEDEGKEKFKKFMEILQSEETKTFIEEKYKGAIIPAF
ncbi:MAG: MetQ/NlpA family ABC transporter substrate-binding protein [Tissierellia bacterium]|nr:MetQ/NlpA family ABC transporter substrate-binding protein [Tissierellia bacterium]